jgi:hypothetical protein
MVYLFLQEKVKSKIGNLFYLIGKCNLALGEALVHCQPNLA